MKKEKKFKNKKTKDSIPRLKTVGFSMLEMLVVVAILGMLSLILYPNIINSLETRDLESTSRDVLTYLHTAKFQAVKMKYNHRVRFSNQPGYWVYRIEREESPGEWNRVVEYPEKSINRKFNVTVSLPNQCIIFSPLGYISNFTVNQNRVVIQSPKLLSRKQPDLRILSVFAGGSIQYQKSQT